MPTYSSSTTKRGRDGLSYLPAVWGISVWASSKDTSSQWEVAIIHGGNITNKLHRYKEESQTWEEYLRPMPSPRSYLSVITTQSAIIACGGEDSRGQVCATVEVYTDETDQWHTADPLPKCRYLMTSVTINDTCYLLGGLKTNKSGYPTKTVICASVTSLVERAKSPPNRFAAAFRSVWKTLKDTPLCLSTAASLSGCLLAVGGWDEQQSPAVYMFQPQTNSWVRMTSGDLPGAVHEVTAIQLPDNELFICGGYSGRDRIKDAFIGSITDYV